MGDCVGEEAAAVHVRATIAFRVLAECRKAYIRAWRSAPAPCRPAL